jgi:NADH-quinone oxidoreductase subunit N
MPQDQLGLIAVVFVMAGLCFRVAAVPLHFYAPDVYEGSPIVIAATLSWVPKAVGFLAIVRALTAVLATKDPGSSHLLHGAVMLAWVIAAATMIWGNFVALLQDNLKRLLAYSSIAHAGYIMVGVAAAFAGESQGGGMYYGSEGVFFYLVAYAVMTLGAFGVISALRIKGQVAQTIEDLAGLGWTHPLPALALSICLLSLAGIPPLVGFWAKFEIFTALLAASQRVESGSFIALAIIGMLSAAAGAYYYLRLVVVMYLRPSKEEVTLSGGWPVALAAGACASLTLFFGLFSSPVSSAARAAALAALHHSPPQHSQVAAAVPSPQPTGRSLHN